VALPAQWTFPSARRLCLYHYCRECKNPNSPQRYAAERRSNMETEIGKDNKIS